MKEHKNNEYQKFMMHDGDMVWRCFPTIRILLDGFARRKFDFSWE